MTWLYQYILLADWPKYRAEGWVNIGKMRPSGWASPNHSSLIIRKKVAAKKRDRREYKAAYRIKNKEQIKKYEASYRIKNSEAIKKRKAAYRAKNVKRERERSAAYAAANKEQTKKRYASWKAKNIEHVKELNAAYRLAHPEVKRRDSHNRRAQKKNNGGRISTDLFSKLFLFQRGKCAICKTCLKKAGYHYDHIITLSRGGENKDSNIQLACPKCNLKKRNKDPIKFMQEMGLLL